MKILPKSGSDNCGLLDTLYNHQNKTFLYNIPENSCNSGHNGKIQNVINCKVLADWPSNENTPYFTIFLNHVGIKPKVVSVTRRSDFSYPEEAILEGLYHLKWVPICTTKIRYTKKNEVANIQCKSNKYFTGFRIEQTKFSSLNYLEINGFDIFGEMNYYDSINKITQSSCRRNHLSIYIISFLLVC